LDSLNKLVTNIDTTNKKLTSKLKDLTSKKSNVSKDDLKKALLMINHMKSLMTHENKIVNLKNLIVEKMQRESIIQGEHIHEINNRLNALQKENDMHVNTAKGNISGTPIVNNYIIVKKGGNSGSSMMPNGQLAIAGIAKGNEPEIIKQSGMVEHIEDEKGNVLKHVETMEEKGIKEKSEVVEGPVEVDESHKNGHKLIKEMHKNHQNEKHGEHAKHEGNKGEHHKDHENHKEEHQKEEHHKELEHHKEKDHDHHKTKQEIVEEKVLAHEKMLHEQKVKELEAMKKKEEEKKKAKKRT